MRSGNRLLIVCVRARVRERVNKFAISVAIFANDLLMGFSVGFDNVALHQAKEF